MTKKEQIQRLQQSFDLAKGENKKTIQDSINKLKLEVYKDNE